jgi:IS5 family transposase
VLFIHSHANANWRSHHRRFRYHMPSMLDRKDGTDASRCMSNRLQMYRLWLHIAAEVRGLLRVLFIRFCSVPADSGLNLVGCSTGSAAGFAPFSILSV